MSIKSTHSVNVKDCLWCSSNSPIILMGFQIGEERVFFELGR